MHRARGRIRRAVSIWGPLLLAACARAVPDYPVQPVAPPPPVPAPPPSVLPVDVALKLDLAESILGTRGDIRSRFGHRKLGAADLEWLPEQPAESIAVAPPYLLVRITLAGRLRVRSGARSCQADSFGATFTVRVHAGLEGFGRKRRPYRPYYRSESDDSPTSAEDEQRYDADVRAYNSRGIRLSDPAVEVQPLGRLECGVPGVRTEALQAPLFDPIRDALTEKAQRLLRLTEVGDRLDELLGSYALQPSEGAACLGLQPSALVLGPPSASDEPGELRLGVEITPAVAERSCSDENVPPNRLRLEREPLLPDARVLASLTVPIAGLEARLLRLLQGRPLGGSEPLSTERVLVRGVHGRLLVRLSVRGAYQGPLYLWGSPALRREGDRYVLMLPELQLADESRARLAERALLPRGLAGDWLRHLADGMRTDVTRSVESVLLGLNTEAARKRAWDPAETLLRKESGLPMVPSGRLLGEFQLPQPLDAVTEEKQILVRLLYPGRLQLRTN